MNLIDVGARGGIHERWEPFHALIDVRAFEPDEAECGRLNALKHAYRIRYYPNALGERDGESATLHITRAPGCSSLYEPNMGLCLQFPYGPNLEVVSGVPVTLSRMDSVCADFKPDVLKIDTQGTELAILRGAGALLDSAAVVELEVEFVPQYIGQPLFADVDTFMRSRGFMLRGLKRSYWRQKEHHSHSFGGQLFHADVLYLHHERIDTAAGHIALAAYHQYDLLAKFGADRLIPSQSWAWRALQTLAARCDNQRARGFVDALRRSDATDWHDADFF